MSTLGEWECPFLIINTVWFQFPLWTICCFTTPLLRSWTNQAKTATHLSEFDRFQKNTTHSSYLLILHWASLQSYCYLKYSAVTKNFTKVTRITVKWQIIISSALQTPAANIFTLNSWSYSPSASQGTHKWLSVHREASTHGTMVHMS